MRKEIKEGSYYWYKPPYNNKIWQIYKCIRVRFIESENQYRADFEIMTDTSYSNSIGNIKNFNEAEILAYCCDEIKDIESAFAGYKTHQKAILTQ